MRLFVAGELPGEARRALGKLQDGFRAAGLRSRWVRPEAIHITLRFLGETELEKIDRLRAALRESAVSSPPLRLRLEGLGTFPSSGPPRVLWVGLVGDLDGLARLAADVERDVVSCGWNPERRPFRPHLTLARIDSGRAGRELRRLLASTGPIAPEGGEVVENLPVSVAGPASFLLEELVLFESRLGPGGAQYFSLDRFPLRGPSS